MRLVRPRPYYVAYEDQTPEERDWCWSEETDDGYRIHSGYYTRRDAEDAIDSFMFKLGEPL